MKEAINKTALLIKESFLKVVEFFKGVYLDYMAMVRDYKKNKRESLARPFALFAGLGYFLLIFVVIYGAGDHVYDGFGAVAPWIIGAIFALMSGIRFWQFLSGTKKFFAQEKQG